MKPSNKATPCSGDQKNFWTEVSKVGAHNAANIYVSTNDGGILKAAENGIEKFMNQMMIEKLSNRMTVEDLYFMRIMENHMLADGNGKYFNKKVTAKNHKKVDNGVTKMNVLNGGIILRSAPVHKWDWLNR